MENTFPFDAQRGQLYGTQEEIEQYRTLAALMDREPEVVWYPASSTHASIARAFNRSRVIHVDPDRNAQAPMQETGYEFHCASVPLELVTVRDDRSIYVPDVPVDLLALLRSSVSDFELSYVRNGGYVLCDNIYRAAHDTAFNGNFQILGAIKKNQLQTEYLDDFVREVESEEEFAMREPHHYQSACEALSNIQNLCPELIVSQQSSFLERYRGLLQMGAQVGGYIIIKRTVLNYLPMKQDAELHLFRKKNTPILIGPEPIR